MYLANKPFIMVSKEIDETKITSGLGKYLNLLQNKNLKRYNSKTNQDNTLLLESELSKFKPRINKDFPYPSSFNLKFSRCFGNCAR